MFFEFIRIFVFLGFAILGAVLFFVYLSPALMEHENQLAQGDKIAQKILNNTNISCDKIISLRLDHANGKIIFYGSTENQLRDIYNIKSCGTHWGWFEP